MDISALPARERILVTSHDLFYRDGIRATGIDRVIAASGVTKVTFYRHFPSKDDLVREFLDHRHTRWMAWFVDALGRRGAHERTGDAGALLLLADVMAEWFADPVFRGCAFINATAEVGGSVEGAAFAATGGLYSSTFRPFASTKPITSCPVFGSVPTFVNWGLVAAV